METPGTPNPMGPMGVSLRASGWRPMGQQPYLPPCLAGNRRTSSPVSVCLGRVVGGGTAVRMAWTTSFALVGMGSVLLHDVVVGEGSIIGAGAVVAPGVEIPPRSLVRGVPGRVVRETTEAEREAIQDSVRKYAENARDFFRRYGESDG